MHESPGGTVTGRRSGRQEAVGKLYPAPPTRPTDPYSTPIFFGGQYVAKALPMIHSRGTGPQ
jgi:hypothetical protein